MEIKGSGQPPSKVSSPELADISKSPATRTAIESWKINQIVKAIVTETNPQQTRLNIQGIVAQTTTPAKLELQVGQQLTLQVSANHSIPELKLIAIETAPQQIIAEQLRSHLPRQQSITHLLSDIKTIATRPQVQRRLPSEVVQQVRKLLAAMPEAAQLNNPRAVKQALQHSGLFLEHNLAQAAQPGTVNYLQQDLRAILLRLAALLKDSLNPSSTEPSTPLHPALNSHVTTTLLKHMPQAQATVGSRLADIASAEQLKLEMIKQIESSLARIHSLQLTSVKSDDTSNPVWAMELPVRHQDTLDLFDVRIEQEQQGNQKDQAKHRWSLSVAFELQGLGPVHVRASYFNDKISASFWVKQQDTHLLFTEYLQLLQQRLIDAGLKIERLNINQGEPQMHAVSHWQHILDEKA